jgi:hypothetical protein
MFAVIVVVVVVVVGVVERKDKSCQPCVALPAVNIDGRCT